MHSAAAAGIRRTLTALMNVLDDAEKSSRQPFTEPSITVAARLVEELRLDPLRGDNAWPAGSAASRRSCA